MAAELPLAPALLDALAEPVLVFERGARLRFANRAALRLMPCEAGMPWPDLSPLLAAPVRQWLMALWSAPTALAPGQVSPGPQAGAVLTRLDAAYWLLCLPLEHAPRAADPLPTLPLLALADDPLRQLHAMLWGSPFPATLQDESFRLIDVNHAYAELVGLPRQHLIGRDPLELQPEEERELTLRDRERLMRDPQHPEVPALREKRLLDTDGRSLWVRAARYVTLTQDGRRLQLTLMQDTSAEHAAREQAERYSRELDQWFDLSPLGMALFDQGGLVLRANSAFEQLVGGPLLELREASPAVCALLHWSGTELALPLDPGAAWVSSDAVLPRMGTSGHGASGASAPGHARGHWVRALLRSYEGAGGQRRTMCMLEDRTAEEERDLAQLQLGTLVDTAGVGLATIASPARVPASPFADTGAEDHPVADMEAGNLMAQGVRRELVLPASLPEFERLQRAMQHGERYEARYAIVHPELGLRWLVSRVQPGRLSSGRPSTSVVTLDVTEQHRAQERAEQLLGEISTILENSPAGIASLRGTTLMHCNQRFERMLRLPLGAGVGTDIRVLLATCTRTGGSADALASQLAYALEHGQLYEAELEVPAQDVPAATQSPSAPLNGAGSHWYALSIRRTGPAGDAPQAIAVLSEITRLKGQQVQLEALAREREQMAQVLGQQADRTRAVLDSVLVGIVTVDEGGAISWLNRSARRMFGGDLGDFLGQSISGVATGDADHPFRHSRALFQQLRDGEALQFECRVCARDGRTFWVVGNAVATLGASGARELVFALMDIEQRRQAEARVAQARESLQRIIEAAPMAITLFDAHTLAVLQINRVAADALGLSAEAAVGRAPEALYPPAQAARLRADLSAALAAPEVVTQREHLIEHASGDKVWDVRYLPLSRASQPTPMAVRVDQILLVASDVSAQRAAQKAELEAAITQREMLVQEVHHRIKNNLQGVAGLLQQIGQRRPEVQPVIAEVVGQVQAIAQVYGLQVGGVGPLRVRQVVEAIAQSVARTFGREIVFALQGDWAQEWSLPEAESIPIALTLNELLTNAIKHSPPGAAVACRLVGEAGGVRIEIDNEGRLATDFRIDHRPSAVSGLGLVRALLPRRHAALAIEQRGARVVALVSLAAPVVKPLPAPAATATAAATAAAAAAAADKSSPLRPSSSPSSGTSA